MKASSQAEGWKRMLIQHGEKGALGIIGVLVLWMMYSGMKKEGLKPDRLPTKLDDRVKNGEQHIIQVSKIKFDNGGEKFNLQEKDYADKLSTGIEKLKVEPWLFNINLEEFPKIAKRTQPMVFPAEEVHATALVVQVAINDEAKVKAQQAIIADRNNAKAVAEAKIAAAKADKEQREKARKDKAAAAAAGRNRGGGSGEGKAPRRPEPLQPAIPQFQQPVAPVVEARQPHPAIQNLTNITSQTYPIAVVTALIPYRKQIDNFNETMVKDRDMIPGRNPADDSPVIAYFTVQRAIVKNPNDPDEKLEWEDNTNQAQDFFARNFKHLTKSDDPVVPSLRGPETPGIKDKIPSWFTVSPLPTLADRKWQREVTHPRIPLITDLTEEEIKVEEQNVFKPAAPQPAGGFGPPMPMDTTVPTEVELPEYVLLRHIDFFVKPGVNYRYRVTLSYKNPNVGLDSKYLDSDVKMTEVLTTTASRPSNSVILPPLHQMVAGGDLTYPPAKRFEGVPTSRVWQWVIDLDSDRNPKEKRGSGEVAKDFAPVAVGDMLDFVGTVKNNLNRAVAAGEDLVDYDFKKQREKVTSGRGIPYLVDVFGKETPPAPRPRPVPTKGGPEGTIAPPVVTAPEPPKDQPYTEILFVDQDGKLRSSTSTYAETLIDNYKLRYESTTTMPGGGGGGGEGPAHQPGGGLFGPPPKGAAAPGRTQNR